MKTCRDFAESFIKKLVNLVANYDKVRLVLNRYLNTSLKEQVRKKRTKGKSTYYHVKDSSLIQNISVKDFFSNVKTKAEFTGYLAAKCLHHSKLRVLKVEEVHRDVWNRKQWKCPCSKHHNHS